jgi:hypothetical protein
MQHACKRQVMTQALKYKGYAVHKPHEKFELWEYEPGPLAPNNIEIKVGHTDSPAAGAAVNACTAAQAVGNDTVNSGCSLSCMQPLIKLSQGSCP